MASEEGFLKAIAAAPQDDNLRLVFADWLEEQGDLRGELVRLTVQVASLSTADPNRDRLLWHIEALHRHHAEAWLGPCRAGIIEWEVHRGLLRLHAPAPWLVETTTHKEGARVMGYVEHLDLGRSMDSVLHLLNHPRLDLLTSLDLSHKGMGDHNVRRLVHHPRLARVNWLNLQANVIFNEGAEALLASRNLGRLSLLDLRYNHISGSILNALLQRFGSALRL